MDLLPIYSLLSSTLKKGWSIISRIVGLLWGVTLSIDLIRLISSYSKLLFFYRNGHKKVSWSSSVPELTQVFLLWRVLVLQPFQKARCLAPRCRSCNHRVCYESFQGTCTNRCHRESSFLQVVQQIQNRIAWLHFFYWGVHFLATYYK